MSTIDLCELYINGNISDAKKIARRFASARIQMCLVERFGYSERKARLTTEHMRGADCWQEACDAE